jgi:SAM-dependent methyltransferase
MESQENGRSGESYGQKKGLTTLEQLGVWLSQRAIRRHLPSRDNLQVLELGCGYRATQLVALRDRVAHATGVDFHIDPELRQLSNFTFLEQSIEDALPHLEPGQYDLVLLISVLEHLRDPVDALTSAFKLLRPGGRLFINIPTWRGKVFLEFAAFRLGLSRMEMEDHKMYYDKRTLWPMLVRAGFRPSQIRLRYHKFGLNLFAIATRLRDDEQPDASSL